MRRQLADLKASDWIEDEEVLLAPLPALAHFAPREYSAAILSMVEEIEQAAEQQGRPPGPRGHRDTDIPHRDPATPTNPIPLVHAVSIQAWKAWRLVARRSAEIRLDSGDEHSEDPRSSGSRWPVTPSPAQIGLYEAALPLVQASVVSLFKVAIGGGAGLEAAAGGPAVDPANVRHMTRQLHVANFGRP